MSKVEQTELEQLQAEVRSLREQLEHLLSGQAELVLRRLAILDDDGVERITADARWGSGEAVVKVRSGDAEAFLYAAPVWNPTVDSDRTFHNEHVGDVVTIGVGSTGTDFRITSDSRDSHGAGRTKIEFEDTHSCFTKELDIFGVREVRS